MEIATTVFDPGSVLSIFNKAPHSFLQPTPTLHTSFLRLAKTYLDPLANDVITTQDARQYALRGKKRRHSSRAMDNEAPVLKMRRLHVESLDVDQIWQQARRVLDAAGTEVERDLPEEFEGDEDESAASVSIGRKQLHFAEANSDAEEALQEDDYGEDGDYISSDGIGKDGADWKLDVGNKANSMAAEGDSEDLTDNGYEKISSDDEDFSGKETRKTIIGDKFGLNDGFFSIDEFNKQSQFLEQADNRGDDGAVSGEEEIDWTVDPIYMTRQSGQANGLKHQGDRALLVSEDEDPDGELNDMDDDGGPTFGNMDLGALEGDSDKEGTPDDNAVAGAGDFANTNEILYADFFAPPAQAAGKKPKARPKGEESTTLAEKMGRNTEDDDMESTISAVHRSLLDVELSEDDEPLSGDDPTHNTLSSHEIRQLALRAEIRALEAANVSSKPWMLTGEALAPARPLNSLLEEDLDFERAGKAVPVATDAVHEDIETLIKRRILARDFDEVVRRRPTDLVTGSQQKRGRVNDFELSDVKSAKSLAEEYADNHLKQTDPNHVDPRSDALKTKHTDIQKQWAAVSSQLDVLCNWHHKPPPPQAEIEVRTDVPRIAMEDAQPSAASDGIGTSVLAPREIYTVGDEGKRAGEIVTRGGFAVAQEEETHDQRQRRRRRAKARARKASGKDASANLAGASAKEEKKLTKKDVLGQLKKSDVGVIGKGGELRRVDGIPISPGPARRPTSNLKL